MWSGLREDRVYSKCFFARFEPRRKHTNTACTSPQQTSSSMRVHLHLPPPPVPSCSKGTIIPQPRGLRPSRSHISHHNWLWETCSAHQSLPPLPALTHIRKPYRSTEEAVDTALHTAPETAGELCEDYSSASYSIIPDILVTQLSHVGPPQLTCSGMKDLKLGSFLSSCVTFSTSSPQGCLMNSLLFSFYANEGVPGRPVSSTIKFAYGTTVVEW